MFFVGPIQFVMEAAALLAAGLQDWVDFGVICGLLLLNACVGFIQECKFLEQSHFGLSLTDCRPSWQHCERAKEDSRT
jgi:hypothetical protein